jgi:phage terminase large subunit-like protein
MMMKAAAVRPSWIFDDSPIPDPFGYGQRAVDFLRVLRHPKSRAPGQAFELPRWQERIVRRIYGPRHEDGVRIVRTVVMLLPRGNRKTSLGAALALLHTIGPEHVPRSQVVCAASDREQARIAFEEAAGIVRAHPYMSQHVPVTDSRHRLEHPKDGARLQAISCDADRQHGGTPYFALVDELHAWPKPDLWHVLRTGLVKVPGTLMVVITTAGRGQENIAFQVIDYARRVARGDIDDPATLPVLFEADPSEDWRSEDLWRTVNPGLADGFPDIEGMRQLAREAENRPSERDAFRQLHCNMWLDHSASPFVEMAVYDQGNHAIDLEDLEASQEPCWLAVDLSSNSDLTVVVACWRNGVDGFQIWPWFFCPADRLRERAERDGVPYPRWAEEGFITPTLGNVVDFRSVEDHIRELCARFDVREIAFDPHYGRNMLANLSDDGFPAVEMRQGWVTMGPAVKELERAIIGGRLNHGGHPVLRWNFDNIVVEADKAGNISFHKGKSRDRIDGAVAAAMAVARCAAGDGNHSSYDSDEWSDEMGFA